MFNKLRIHNLLSTNELVKDEHSAQVIATGLWIKKTIALWRLS